MSKIRSKNTTPEIAVRKFLYRRGFRYRLHRKDLPGKPDIVLSRYKTAIFVNGCFWHCHTCKAGSGKRLPKSNKEFWRLKLTKNKKRDKDNHKKIRELGWKLIVIWECEAFRAERLGRKLRSLNWLGGFQ